MKSAKIPANRRTAHTAPTKMGMGDHYGSGIKNKVGKLREFGEDKVLSGKKLKKPPKSLA